MRLQKIAHEDLAGCKTEASGEKEPGEPVKEKSSIQRSLFWEQNIKLTIMNFNGIMHANPMKEGKDKQKHLIFLSRLPLVGWSVHSVPGGKEDASDVIGL